LPRADHPSPFKRPRRGGAGPRTPLTTTLTANVLGLWPGSDPVLSDEVIIIGAHYDHIGRTPDRLYFPGANQNGSGVADMLEIVTLAVSWLAGVVSGNPMNPTSNHESSAPATRPLP